MGRPSEFSQEIAERICEWIAEGKSLREFCERDDAPSKTTVLKWLRTFPEFASQYTRAREDSGHDSHDYVLAISDMCVAGLIDPAAARVAIDARKWSAGKMNPKKYGEKVVHSGDSENPILVGKVERVVIGAADLPVLEHDDTD